ncbi:MAG: hypothetical protein V4808_07385 [Pseudomonadota bacterium]
MDHPILFNPDNRLLSSATGDFGMYGGQSDARFSVHEVSDDAAVSISGSAAANVPADLAASDPSTPVAPQADAGASDAVPDGGSGALAPQSFLITPSVTEFAPVQHVTLDDASAPVQSDWAPSAPEALASAPALDAPEPVATILPDSPLMGPAAGLLDELATAPEAPGVLTSAVGDTLEGLAGSDPLGGVATLVNLVTVSDTFDLTPLVAPLFETVSDTATDLLDGLLGAESLLGDLHDDGLLGGHIIPDHPLGL